MKKKIIIISILVLVAAIVMGLFFMLGGKKAGVEDLNYSATQRGWKGGTLGRNDILILKSITHDAGGDSKAEFYVYRLQEGDSAANYMHLKVSELPKDAPLQHIGNATCIFIGGDVNSVYNLQILYTR